MKTKKALAIILTFILSFGVLTVAFADETAEVPEGYTPIYTAEDLYNIRNDLAGKYILMNDIDLSVYENWEPIGTEEAPFTGELDGNGFVVDALTVDVKCEENKNYSFGLFGYINGTEINSEYIIKNLIVSNASVRVENIKKDAASISAGIISGLCSSASLLNCAATGKVSVEGFSINEIGGIVGKCKWSNISCCSNYADLIITASTNSTQLSIGGISGVAKRSSEQECCNYGDVSVEGTEINQECAVKIGGIDGDGSENTDLLNSYNRGNISVGFSTDTTYIGGISGESNISVNIYNSGKVICPENFAGCSGAISGNIYSDWLAIGAPEEIRNAYYADEKMIPAYDGESIPDSFTDKPFVNVNLLSDEEFRNQESFVGFDFDAVWTMEENGYPVLQNQPKITLKEELKLEIGKTYKIKDKIADWKSTNKTVVFINENSEIMSHSAGEATILIEFAYGYKTEYMVKVTEPITEPVSKPQEK